MHRLTHEEGVAVFKYIKQHPKTSTASLVKMFRTSAATIGRIRKGTWKAHPNAKPAVFKTAKLVKPTTKTQVTTTDLPADQFTNLFTEVDTSLKLLAETAGKLGFEAVVHFKAK